MTKKKAERQNAIDKFERLFTKTFGEKSIYNDEEDDRIEVGVPLSVMEWDDIEPRVEKLMVESGLDRYFEIGGAGTGFGMRDISLYEKE